MKRCLLARFDFDGLQSGSLVTQQLGRGEALDLIVQGRQKRYDPRIVDLFVDIVHASDHYQEQPCSTVCSGDLKPGRVLAEDLFTKDGVLLLSKDCMLNEKLIRKVRDPEAALSCQFDISIRTGRPVTR